MKLQRTRLVVVARGLAMALALFLFPEWDAVRPKNGLSMPLGHGWIFSPPATLHRRCLRRGLVPRAQIFAKT